MPRTCIGKARLLDAVTITYRVSENNRPNWPGITFDKNTLGSLRSYNERYVVQV